VLVLTNEQRNRPINTDDDPDPTTANFSAPPDGTEDFHPYTAFRISVPEGIATVTFFPTTMDAADTWSDIGDAHHTTAELVAHSRGTEDSLIFPTHLSECH
jgi:hypothetical protein